MSALPSSPLPLSFIRTTEKNKKFFIRCRASKFESTCEFKDKCERLEGFGTNLESAQRHFVHELRCIVDDHAKAHNEKGADWDKKNPKYADFWTKALDEYREERDSQKVFSLC